MMRVPILGGPLRGSWWALGSPGQPGRVLSGTYEPRTASVLDEHVNEGNTVLDAGAHTGYFTLLSSRLVGPAGRVWAFEPAAKNCRYLRRNVAINRCDNVCVEEAAVSDRDGRAAFVHGTGSGTGRLRRGGPIPVRTVALDSYCEKRSIQPSLIKIDVEGSELHLLRGSARLLARDRPVLLLSTHGANLHHACLSLLADAGYRFEPITGQDQITSSELLCLPG